MAARLRQSSPGTVSLTISDPDVQNGYQEALLPYYSDCRIHSDLDLLDAIKGGAFRLSLG